MGPFGILTPIIYRGHFLVVSSISSSTSDSLLFNKGPREGLDRFTRDTKMKFVMEFAEHLILDLMEDPEARDRQFRHHVYSVRDGCDKAKEMWTYPVRPYGFWTFERVNSQLAWDAQISHAVGRRDPYDNVLQKIYESSK